jgi:hypothetical protein
LAKVAACQLFLNRQAMRLPYNFSELSVERLLANAFGVGFIDWLGGFIACQ